MRTDALQRSGSKMRRSGSEASSAAQATAHQHGARPTAYEPLDTMLLTGPVRTKIVRSAPHRYWTQEKNLAGRLLWNSRIGLAGWFAPESRGEVEKSR